MNKKLTIGILAASMSVIAIGGTTLLVANLINQNNLPDVDNTNPLNRGDNYTRYDLSSYVNKDVTLKTIVKKSTKSGEDVKYIDETALREYLTSEFRNILKNIDKFSSRYNDYQFTFNYQIQSDKDAVLLDLVWNLPNANFFYYDQLKISLKD